MSDGGVHASRMAFGRAEPIAAAAMARALARGDDDTSDGLVPSGTALARAPLASSSQAMTTSTAGLAGQAAVQERTEHPQGGLLGARPSGLMQHPMESLLGQLQGSTEPGGVAAEPSTTLATFASEVQAWTHMATPALRQQLHALRAADLAVAGRQRPTLAEWRQTPALHEQWWACFPCQLVMPMSSQACGLCGTTSDEASGAAAKAQLDAAVALASRTAYGRKLVCLSDREPLLSTGLEVAVGGSAYYESVRGSLSALATQSCEKLIEAKPADAVCAFDGWLALQTNASMRFYTRQHVLAFMEDHRSVAEAVTADFVAEHGKEIAVSWSPTPVLVLPKSGWWRYSLSYISEHDLRIVRALLGASVAAAPGANVASTLRNAVLYGPCDAHLYGALNAVAASLFVRMAMHQRGPDGRARRAGGEPASHQAFAANGFIPPR